MLAKLLCLILFFPLGLDAPEKNKVRLMYAKAVEEKKSATELMNWLDKQPQTPYILGYKGAIKMVMAKHLFNPFGKLRSFNEGKKMLSAAINRDDKNLELVFLRYATQIETPSFLGYKDDLARDKAFILRNLRTIKNDEALVNLVLKYMQKQQLSIAEKNQLKID